jgi:hypothetical protein
MNLDNSSGIRNQEKSRDALSLELVIYSQYIFRPLGVGLFPLRFQAVESLSTGKRYRFAPFYI